MATRDFSVTEIRTRHDHVHIVTWEGLLNGDDGQRLEMVGSYDRSVQVEGTFGAGGRLEFEGSNDGVNYHTLTNLIGTPMQFKSAGIEKPNELTRFVRPRVSGGGGSTDLDVFILLRGMRP